MNNLKLGIVGAIAGGAVATLLWMQHRSLIQLRQDNVSLSQQVEQLAALAADNERLSNLLAKATSGPAPEQVSELLKLRGEVGSLKRELADAARKQSILAATARQQAPPAPAPAVDAMEQQKEMSMAKLSYTKQWMLAFFQYATQHQGQAPANFEAATPFLPAEVKGQTNVVPDQFEIVYQGPLNEMANPQNVIVIREKEAWQALDGGWARTYSFADGHTEIHKAADGNFGPWESMHVMPSQAPAQPGQ